MLAADTFASILVIMIAAVKNSVTHLRAVESMRKTVQVSIKKLHLQFLRSAHTMRLVAGTSRRDWSHRVNLQLVPATSRIVCADLYTCRVRLVNLRIMFKRSLFYTGTCTCIAMQVWLQVSIKNQL